MGISLNGNLKDTISMRYAGKSSHSAFSRLYEREKFSNHGKSSGYLFEIIRKSPTEGTPLTGPGPTSYRWQSVPLVKGRSEVRSQTSSLFALLLYVMEPSTPDFMISLNRNGL